MSHGSAMASPDKKKEQHKNLHGIGETDEPPHHDADAPHGWGSPCVSVFSADGPYY
jgi:hypothetical protein